MKKILVSALFSVLYSSLLAQNGYQFTKGLMVRSANRYGREALYTDALSYKLYSETLNTPVDGGVFDTDNNGNPVKWQLIEADSLNRFRNRGAGFGQAGGYIYLTYTSAREQKALLHIKGNAAVYFNKTLHAGDLYSMGWLYIPVQLKKGLNELYVRGTFIEAKLIFPAKPVQLNIEDATLPFIVAGKDASNLKGSVVVINNSDRLLKGLKMKSTISGNEVVTDLPDVPAMATRKITFNFNGNGITEKGMYKCMLQLTAGIKQLDTASISITSSAKNESYSNTFISDIDGSLQYYSVTPQTPDIKTGDALFFSVHGAGVEAISQARAYKPKDWGTLVAPTNRRPRGFNWEDWGRLDALEVLSIAKEEFKPNPQRIYLTGHSMGGHGTWFLGATYPDKWAAIAPCAGYPTLKGYGSADGLVPDSSSSRLEQTLLNASNQSDMIKLVSNYQSLGVYIFHGDDDKTVSVNYARQMKKLLAPFHSDMSYYEYPGGSHWFGDQSVDWNPIFDFFKWHTLKTSNEVDTIDFTTANPAISSGFHWAGVHQQEFPLAYSRIKLKRDKNKKLITGTTKNINVLRLNLEAFNGQTVTVLLDRAEPVTLNSGDKEIYLRRNKGQWQQCNKPGDNEKGPHRYGTLKEAFNNRMVFVYSTIGTIEENNWSLNKAKYDAEAWYYRGNGAVDIIADRDFDAVKYKDRGIIIYGNKSTNKAWMQLLQDCPLQVERNKITVGDKIWQGDELSACYVWPIKNSAKASGAVITGTGIKGMNATMANQYFAGASGFPDFMVYSLDMLKTGVGGVKIAGYFNNSWQLDKALFAEDEK